MTCPECPVWGSQTFANFFLHKFKNNIFEFTGFVNKELTKFSVRGFVFDFSINSERRILYLRSAQQETETYNHDQIVQKMPKKYISLINVCVDDVALNQNLWQFWCNLCFTLRHAKWSCQSWVQCPEAKLQVLLWESGSILTRCLNTQSKYSFSWKRRCFW